MKNMFAIRFNIIFFLLGLIFSGLTFSQTSTSITNVRFAQRVDSTYKVDIYYDLYVPDGDSMPIAMEVSDNDGDTWNYSFDYSNLSGAICTKQTTGTNKHVIWDYRADHPFDFKPKVRIKLKVGGCGGCQGITQFSYGGQIYNTVQIGTQCWMRENLNIGTMTMSILNYQDHSDCSNNGIIEKYCFENNLANCSVYGGLYDWDEMMGYTTAPGVQGICPAGWHIPTDAEWCTLTVFLDATVDCNLFGGSGINAGGKLKEAGFNHWNPPNEGATNESGFTALPGGDRLTYGGFGDIGNYAVFWSSSMNATTYAIYRYLTYYDAVVYRNYYHRTSGFSVRCLRDN